MLEQDVFRRRLWSNHKIFLACMSTQHQSPTFFLLADFWSEKNRGEPSRKLYKPGWWRQIMHVSIRFLHEVSSPRLLLLSAKQRSYLHVYLGMFDGNVLNNAGEATLSGPYVCAVCLVQWERCVMWRQRRREGFFAIQKDKEFGNNSEEMYTRWEIFECSSWTPKIASLEQ